MALDLFQVTDKTDFWDIFATTSAVTYILAAFGLFAIYRKGLLDLLRAWSQVLFWTQEAPYSRGKETFFEREKRQRHRENLGWMQRATYRRAPLRRMAVPIITSTETGQGHTARALDPERPRHSQATFITQALWRSDEEVGHMEAHLQEPSTLSSRSNASPVIQTTGSPKANVGLKPGQNSDMHNLTNFTTGLAKELRNI